MFKRILLALAVVAAMSVGTVPKSASADWGRRGHHSHHYYGHWHGHGHGHWNGHWHHRPIVYPPIVIGGYYPARYYYADPYWGPYGGYGYYGSGVQVSFGW